MKKLIILTLVIIGIIGYKSVKAEEFIDGFESYTIGDSLSTISGVDHYDGSYAYPKIASSSPNFGVKHLNTSITTGAADINFNTTDQAAQYFLNWFFLETDTETSRILYQFKDNATTTLAIYISDGYDRPACASSYDSLSVFIYNNITLECTLIVEDLDFDSWHYILIETVNNYNWDITVDGISQRGYNEYGTGTITTNFYIDINQSDVRGLYLDDFLYRDYIETPDIEIIEIDLTPENVEIVSETFLFPPKINCLIDDTECRIKVFYSESDIGADLYLLESTATSVDKYIDLVTLEDKPLLNYELTPTIRSSTQVDTYQYFLWYPELGTSTLYGYTKVYWVETSTEMIDSESEGLNTIVTIFKNLFPLSIMFQVWDIIDNVRINNEEVEQINITLNDIIPEEYSGVYFETSTTAILNNNLISDNLGETWEKIQLFLSYMIYLIGTLYAIHIIAP